MSTIRIASDNIYYISGLESLIKDMMDAHEREKFSFVAAKNEQAPGVTNIVFRDMMVSIFLHKKEKLWYRHEGEGKTVVLHIPFICRNENLPAITGKIRKILTISETECTQFSRQRNYRSIGLKDFMQLSATENKIIFLIGKGYRPECISRMLNRSEKTINTHCRNAIRKLGMINRVEFYKYASFVASCTNKEWNTLCL